MYWKVNVLQSKWCDLILSNKNMTIENSTSNATLNSKARRKIEDHFDATLILKPKL